MRFDSRSLVRFAGVVALATSLGASALAQTEVYPLVLESDSVPGVGLVTAIEDIAVSDTGTWLVRADTSFPDPDTDGVLLENGVLIQREGQTLPSPLGALLDDWGPFDVNAVGNHVYKYFLSGTVLPQNDQAVYFNDHLVLLAGTTVLIPQFSPGTLYDTFLGMRLNKAQQMLVSANVNDPNIPGLLDHALLTYQLDGSGGVLSSQVVWKQGDVLPGQLEPVVDFFPQENTFAFNDSGDVAFLARIAGDTNYNRVAYRNGTLLAQKGLASPLLGRKWKDIDSECSLALNDKGEYVFKAELDGDPASDHVIVKNGAKFVQKGDTLAAISPWVLTSFGTGLPMFLDDDGHVLWWGEWNDPDTTKNSGIFFDHQLLVQAGVTQTVHGLTLTAVPGLTDMTANHRHVVFTATLETGQDGAFLIELPIEPTSYCVSKTNSLGCSPKMMSFGTPSLTSSQPFLLNASQLINQSAGLLAYGYAESSTPFFGGTLCLGAPISRGPVMFTNGNPAIPPDCSGSMSFDFNAYAQLGGDPALFAGVDVYTQYWSRDYFDAFGTSLTDAMKFTLLP